MGNIENLWMIDWTNQQVLKFFLVILLSRGTLFLYISVLKRQITKEHILKIVIIFQNIHVK
jgi:hypothetical protein